MWTGLSILVALAVIVSTGASPKASAINGGRALPTGSGQGSFTTALLADTGLSADGVALAAEGRLLCGGALVSRSWVLTAKHCVRGGLVARLDSLDSSSGGTLHRIVAVEPYPDGDVAVDAALLKIDPPAASDGIALSTPAELSLGRGVSLFGWGKSKPDSELSPVLKRVDVQVVAPTSCTDVNAAELCLADPADPNASACFGDSGGPALVLRGGEYVLAGVASRAGGMAPVCEGSTVYISAPYVSTWALEVMSGSP